jgi:hypothetical protein
MKRTFSMKICLLAFCFSLTYSQTKFAFGEYDAVTHKLQLRDALPAYPWFPIDKTYFEISGGGMNSISVDECYGKKDSTVDRYNLISLDTNMTLLYRGKQVLLDSLPIGGLYAHYNYDYRTKSENNSIQVKLECDPMNSRLPDTPETDGSNPGKLASASIARIFEVDGITLFINGDYSGKGKLFAVSTVLVSGGKWYYGNVPLALSPIEQGSSTYYAHWEKILELSGIPESVNTGGAFAAIKFGKSKFRSTADYYHRFYDSGYAIRTDVVQNGIAGKSKYRKMSRSKIDRALRAQDRKPFNISWQTDR